MSARRYLMGIVVVAALAGCSTEPTTLDQTATEGAVADAATDAFPTPVSEVACPDDIPVAEGEQFTCTVALASDLGTVRVEVTQGDAEGTLLVEPVDAVLVVAEVAEDLSASLDTEFGRSFEVNCGKDEFLVAEVGGTFQCRAKDDTSSRTVRVTVRDGAGTLSFEVLPGAD